jgi:hypothetical protein
LWRYLKGRVLIKTKLFYRSTDGFETWVHICKTAIEDLFVRVNFSKKTKEKRKKIWICRSYYRNLKIGCQLKYFRGTLFLTVISGGTHFHGEL